MYCSAKRSISCALSRNLWIMLKSIISCFVNDVMWRLKLRCARWRSLIWRIWWWSLWSGKCRLWERSYVVRMWSKGRNRDSLMFCTMWIWYLFWLVKRLFFWRIGINWLIGGGFMGSLIIRCGLKRKSRLKKVWFVLFCCILMMFWFWISLSIWLWLWVWVLWLMNVRLWTKWLVWISWFLLMSMVLCSRVFWICCLNCMNWFIWLNMKCSRLLINCDRKDSWLWEFIWWLIWLFWCWILSWCTWFLVVVVCYLCVCKVETSMFFWVDFRIWLDWYCFRSMICLVVCSCGMEWVVGIFRARWKCRWILMLLWIWLFKLSSWICGISMLVWVWLFVTKVCWVWWFVRFSACMRKSVNFWCNCDVCRICRLWLKCGSLVWWIDFLNGLVSILILMFRIFLVIFWECFCLV